MSRQNAARMHLLTLTLVVVSSVPLLQGLGPHRRAVKGCSPSARQYFDQGLALLYAFNHDEALRSFREAGRLSPSCAMAHWGVAAANGPHINFPIVPEPRAKEAWEALQLAEAHAAQASEVEQALIAAQRKRYADPPPADRAPLDRAYAEAMREVAKQYPNDADVQALFAEAMMDLRPWDLWTADGKPQEGTPEIVATLERALAKSPKHLLANHLLIHAIEASPEPQKADGAAERLRALAPGLGHLVHMPTHIDVRLGRWEKAIASNAKAIAADTAYRAKSGKQGFYNLYMAHNRHLLTFAAMMSGQSKLALGTIAEMVKQIPDDWLKENAGFADGFVGMPVEVLIRFGRWDELLAVPEPPEHLPVSRSLRLYGRGVALASTGKAAEARAEEKAFLAQKAKVPAEATFGNNGAADLLGVAEKLLAGEIAYREGKHDLAVAELTEAVAREDKLRYDEPPDWIQPVRHALGAVLLELGRAADAESVYRVDLKRAPGNVWALHGLAESHRLQKKDAEAKATDAQLRVAMKNADVKLTSSCMCLP